MPNRTAYLFCSIPPTCLFHVYLIRPATALTISKPLCAISKPFFSRVFIFTKSTHNFLMSILPSVRSITELRTRRIVEEFQTGTCTKKICRENPNVVKIRQKL